MPYITKSGNLTATFAADALFILISGTEIEQITGMEQGFLLSESWWRTCTADAGTADQYEHRFLLIRSKNLYLFCKNMQVKRGKSFAIGR